MDLKMALDMRRFTSTTRSESPQLSARVAAVVRASMTPATASRLDIPDRYAIAVSWPLAALNAEAGLGSYSPYSLVRFVAGWGRGWEELADHAVRELMAAAIGGRDTLSMHQNPPGHAAELLSYEGGAKYIRSGTQAVLASAYGLSPKQNDFYAGVAGGAALMLAEVFGRH